ncbi:MAG TPA: tetratricopeptide repeat protein [Patescibacteria group bacterium]|nr:tetratricopeptide repeat protein [Patescibacteria group bacterium]
MSRRAASALFALALALRLIYIHEIRSLVWFDVPLVDGANYFRIAKAIAGGDLLAGHAVFWQPPLYSYFLALLLGIFGPDMGLVYASQAVIGALSCVLAAGIGARVGGSRAGIATGLVMALYGPLIHFDAQPLIPVLHIVLALGGLALLLRAAEEKGSPAGRRVRWCMAGLLWGLAAIATPNILLAVPVAAVWIARRREPAEVAAGGRRRAVAFFVAGVCLPVAAIAVRNLAVAGEPVLISSNGGINFYIGNNPDYDVTVRIRPGGEFARLEEQPENLGILGEAAKSRWFTARAVADLVHDPVFALRLYARKTLDLAAGREIPRNENIYDYRRTSILLRALVWRFGPACPFGLVAPLAAAGVAVIFRRRPAGPGAGPGAVASARTVDPGRGRSAAALLLLYALAYSFSILLFFPTDRYRLAIVPVLAVFAGACLGAPAAVWRMRAVVAAAALGLVTFNLDALTPSESWPEEEALNRAYAFQVKGRLDEARAECLRAIELNPRRIDPRNTLAVMAAEAGDREEAVRRYREVLELAPDFVDVRRSLGEVLNALGRRDEARHEWQVAVGLAPAAGIALADLSLSYLDEGSLEAAFDYGERAVRARPDLGETHYALALAARALHRRSVVLKELGEAERLFPEGSPGRLRAREILTRMRQRDAG